MLRLTNLALAYGARVLYEHASVLANPGERIALVGENGSGKTTLFRAILGEITPEDGTIEAPSPERIAHVAQTIEVSDESALSYVLHGHAPLVAARIALEKAERGTNAMELADAHATLAELDEGAIRAQAQTIMHGLGFLAEDEMRSLAEFSGGWRNRLALARSLMCPADLLLLDEPTNHLDMDSLIWLEAWLRHIDCTVIIISHDREFLDRAVQNTWAIEDGTLKRWAGNYSAYEQQKIEALRLQDAAAKAYERKASHLTAFIERFRYKATKARQAQSRIKMLEKLEAIEPVRSHRRWRFEFLAPDRCPEHLIDLEHATLGYGEQAILNNVTLSIRAGERIGILGVNGAGKTTLVKSIEGSLKLLTGERRLGQGTVIGYFAQHQLEQLDLTATPFELLRHKAPNEHEQVIRDFLGRFRFTGEFADTPIEPMSGGEKARLALANLVWDKPNLLVLDEPTNHLDMSTREALTMALSTFEGTLILVSHDRYLLRTCCERLVLVHEGVVGDYEGDLDDYAQLVLEHRKAQSGLKERTATPNRREQRKVEAQLRAQKSAQKKPLLAALERLEKEIAERNATLAALDAKLSDTAWYQGAPAEEVSETLKARGETASRIEAIEERWLELSEQIEAIG